jgi:ornithine--oxo-acid transaminase
MTALKVLQEEKLSENAERLGNIFRQRMNALKEKSPLIKDVRGKGLLNAVEMDESASQTGRTAWQFCLLLKSRGVLAKPTHVNMFVPPFDFLYCVVLTLPPCSIRFAPPLVISQEDLEKAIQVIEQCLVDFDKVGPSSYMYGQGLLIRSRPA